MPRDGSEPMPFKWTTGRVMLLLVTVMITSAIVTTSLISDVRHEDVTSIVINHRYERDSCFVLKTSTWKIINGTLVIKNKERGSTKLFPLNEIKSIEITERKVRVLND